MPARLYTAPASEPVTLAEAKAQLRLEHSYDDTFVTTLLTVARQWVEEYCRRGLVTQTWDLILDGFPDTDDTLEDGGTELPFGALASITSVTYYDAANASQTLAASYYAADTTTTPGRIRLKPDQEWPDTYARYDAVTVRYVVGTAAASVPKPIHQAMLLLISQLYEHRTPVVTGTITAKVDLTLEALLSPYRLVRL